MPSLYSQTGFGDQSDKAKILAPGRVAGWIFSDGRIFRNPQGNSGLEYPSNSNQFAVYAAGLWIGAKVDGDVRTAINEYYTTFENGPIGADGKTVEKGASKWRLYTITKMQANDPNSEEFKSWMRMEEYGAPTWIDTLDNIKKPRVVGDMNFWSVYNDANTSHGDTGSDPLGAEINQLSWSYASTDVLGDAIFLKYTIKNKSVSNWSDTYFSFWVDADLGDAGDDFAGCDTLKSLSFMYNASSESPLGNSAVGFDFLQGPVVPQVGATANYNFGKLQNYENLPMSSFMVYIGSTASWGDPSTKDEVYQYMNARNKINEDASSFPGFPGAGHSIKYLLTGDPESGTGFLDSNSGDRVLMMTAGPFEMAAGEEQEFVVASFMATGKNHLNAVTELKEQSDQLQKVYDKNFKLLPPILAPKLGQLDQDPVNYKPSYLIDEFDKISITLNWQAADEQYAENDYLIKDYNDYFNKFIVDTAGQVNYTEKLAEAKKLKFAGYIVYQYPTAERKKEDAIRIAIFDDPSGLELVDINGNPVSTYYTFANDEQSGGLTYQAVFKSEARGLAKSITISEDLITHSWFKKGKPYYFDVKAFAVNPWSRTGVLESEDAKLITAIPTFPDKNVKVHSSVGDIIDVTKNGQSDGDVLVTVVDPLKVTGKDYLIGFKENGTWFVVRAGQDTIINNIIKQPTDLFVSQDYPIADGLKFQVLGAPATFIDFRVTANASGALDPPAGAAAEYRNFPGLGRTNIATQQVSGLQYLLGSTGGGTETNASVTYQETVEQWTYYSGGQNGSGKKGLVYLAPNEYEMRFTAAGSMAIEDVAASKSFIHVPFELWNIGDPTDPSDDFKMIALILDRDNSGTWNMRDSLDHGMSGGDNDPFTEDVFWLQPNDHTPGTAGYDALIAMDPTTFSSQMQSDQNALTTVALTNFVLIGYNAETDYSLPETGTVFRIATSKPNSPSVSFTFTSPKAASFPNGSSEDGITSLQHVKVVPNPFYEFKESGDHGTSIYFTRLPAKATIRIFTLNGELVHKIYYSESRDSNGSSQFRYNLKNSNGRSLVSGMYIYHIEADNMKSVYGKFAVVRNQSR